MSVYTGVIDDNDGTILFSANWDLWQPNNPDPRNYKSTLHSTGVPGSFARVRFTGSRVAVVSTIATGSGALSRASFSIDNGPPIPVSVVTTPPVQFQYMFWDSGPLPFGSHLLVIVNLDNQAFFRIDHIDYDPTDSNSPKSASSVAAVTPATLTRAVTVEQILATSTVVVETTAGLVGPAETTVSTDTSMDPSQVTSTSEMTSSSASAYRPTASALAATLTSQSFPSPTDTITGTSGTGALDNVAHRDSTSVTGSMPVGAIVGGVAAAVLILVGLGVLFFFLKRRRDQKVICLSEGASPISVCNPTIPRPFIRRSHQVSASSLSVGTPGMWHSTNETRPLSDQSSLALPIANSGHPGSSRGHTPQPSTSSTLRNDAARTKHAEFVAERQHMKINTGYPPGLLLDVDAPPAYSGQVRDSMEGGRRSFF